VIQRVLVLSGYLFRSLLFSLGGLLYILLALAFYLVMFAPGQRTPDADYFILVIGVFGLVLSFLVTLTVSSHANQAVHFPFLVRLPSRPEYLTAVLTASLALSMLLQATVAIAALLAGGPTLRLIHLLQIPPIWIAGQILFSVLALHASDLVTSGWSRVYVFGLIGFLLYFPRVLAPLSGWLAGVASSAGSTFLTQGWTVPSDAAFGVNRWLLGSGPETLTQLLRAPFWPFTAIGGAIRGGSLGYIEALAPAIVLLYAAGLFVMASAFFSAKDLFLTE
jgi:hypothetical protein